MSRERKCAGCGVTFQSLRGLGVHWAHQRRTGGACTAREMRNVLSLSFDRPRRVRSVAIAGAELAPLLVVLARPGHDETHALATYMARGDTFAVIPVEVADGFESVALQAPPAYPSVRLSLSVRLFKGKIIRTVRV